MDLPRTSANGSDARAAADHSIADILRVIRDGERFLVCSHSRPDGDAVGSMLAMGKLLEAMGKRADLVSADRIQAVYRALPGADNIRTALRVHGPYDAVILLECDGPERTRLQGLEKFFLINIDHHATGLDFADINWIDHQAACVGEMVYRLFLAAEVEGHSRCCQLHLHHCANGYGWFYLWRDARVYIRAGSRFDAGGRRSDSHCATGLFFNLNGKVAAAWRSAQESASRGASGVAVDHTRGYGEKLRCRGRLRGHRELRALDCRSGGSRVSARNAGEYDSSEPPQQREDQCGCDRRRG